MNILIGLIPALGWGLLPLFVNKIGGKPINQIVGTTCGTFLLALVVLAIRRPEITAVVFLFSFISGAFWAFGQMLQYTAYTEIGVSKAMPVSTGFQLVGTSVVGVIVFGEWPSMRAKLIGFGAVALIIVGVLFTTYQQNKSKGNGSMKKGIITLLISTIGYVGYSAFPRFVSADGWAEFFPQATGMLVAALLFSLFMTKGKALAEKKSYQNILAGFVFACAALAYLISTTLNGVATGFALSQMNVVLATLGSIWFLGEKKTKKEMSAVIAGLALVVCGGIIINFM